MRTVAMKSQYQTIALASIHESTANPRRSFDESKLAELADYVAGHIIGILCRSSFCGRRRQKAHGSRRSAFRGAHKDHNELSHFNSSSSLRHTLLRGDDVEVATGGRQAATAAIFPLRVISA
jgi:hypothetical protein